MAIKLKEEFELPIGYTKDGVLFKWAVLTLPTGQDIIDLSNDQRFKALTRKGSMDDENPAVMFDIESTMIQTVAILFPRILKLKESQDTEEVVITDKDVRGMYQVDLTKITQIRRKMEEAIHKETTESMKDEGDNESPSS